MPAFGDNPNVACYMDDLYVYLRARANDAVGRVRPAKKEDKPEAYTEAENSCMGKYDERASHSSCSDLKSEVELRMKTRAAVAFEAKKAA